MFHVSVKPNKSFSTTIPTTQHSTSISRHMQANAVTSKSSAKLSSVSIDKVHTSVAVAIVVDDEIYDGGLF